MEDKVAAVTSSPKPAAPATSRVRAEWAGRATRPRRQSHQRRQVSFTAPQVDYAGLSP